MTITLVGNWKTTLSLKDVKAYCSALGNIPQNKSVTVVIAPSFLHLPYVRDAIIGSQSGIKMAAQDCSAFHDGAHTGDVSAAMLHELGCKYVIVGHSERRTGYNEGSDILSLKLECALNNKIRPIYCIGEDFEARRTNAVLHTLRQQLRDVGLSRLTASKAIIAYEPIWSIGTGLTPTTEQIAEVASFVDDMLPGLKVLYGGSVSPDNAASISSISNISGLLVGKASTDITQFTQIASALL